MEYNFKEVEKKWQSYWQENKTYRVEVDPSKPKYYVLDMFKVEDRMPRHYIKFIRDGLYEFRVSYGNNELKEEYYETKGNQ